MSDRTVECPQGPSGNLKLPNGARVEFFYRLDTLSLMRNQRFQSMEGVMVNIKFYIII